MSIAQRLIDSCTKTDDGCVCTAEVSDEEWQEAGSSDPERVRNLEAIGRSAGKIGCDCHCTAALFDRTLVARCSADPTRHSVTPPTL